MCGIAGYAVVDGTHVGDHSSINAMLACLAHRGPDDEGVYRAEQVVLGHRRLSVIDPAGGHQPLTGARESTVAVVNGEIYNFVPLRDELSARGHRFRTQSDSEVVAHAYDEWGAACFERFDGMFAVALWDGSQQELVLARDRLGEKPLYYARTAHSLIFASELSALRKHPECPSEIDLGSLSEYLALEYVPAPRTILKNVRKLEPGSWLRMRAGEYQVQRFWELQPHTIAASYPEATTELRSRLADAVRSRLVSDVPLGVFLSGGIDSSIVAALAAQMGTIRTFSIGFAEASFDESSHARLVARHIGSEHHEHVLHASEMAGLVHRLPELLDEPLGDASILPTHVLSRFARENVTVALGGDGGDELFAGYPMHQGHRVAPILRRLPPFVHHAAREVARVLPASERNFSFGFKARTFLAGSEHTPPENHGRWMASFAPEAQQQLMTPETWRAAGGPGVAFRSLHDAWTRTAGSEPLSRTSLLDLLTYLPGDILMKVDRASMAVGLEVRAPFLAQGVVEFAAGLPDAYRMRGIRGKRILRDAARDLLPSGILGRGKKGFGVPVAAWLRGELRPLLLDVLSPDRIRKGGLFDPGYVAQLIASHLSGRADNRKPLWTLLVLELWRSGSGRR